MPRPHRAPSLSEICYRSIVTNMDSLWCADFLKNYDGEEYRYLLGPFDYLPSVMVQQILSHLIKKGLLKIHHLQLLLDSRTSALELLFSAKRLNQRMLHRLITFRCQNLIELCLPNFQDLTPKHLETLIGSLPKLLRLDLSHTNTTDKVMAAIGATCRNLRVLDVSGCRRVSDVGLRELCGQSVGEKPKCPSLRFLHVLNTGVSCFGLRLALENLKDLGSLYTSCSLRRWDDAGYESIEGATYPLDTLFLETFNHDMPHDETIVLRKILSKCPQIESLTLQFLPVTREFVVYLSSLASLREFTAYHDGSDDQIFQYGYRPFLRAQGVKLLDLQLQEVSGVDLELIGQCCPLLSNLDIATTPSSLMAFEDLPKEAEQLLRDFSYFPNLTSVSLMMDNEANFSVSHGKILLSCCHNLSTLFFTSVQALTDELIHEVRRQNKLTNLKNCYIVGSDNFRPDSLDFLIKEENALEVLQVEECHQVYRRDYEAWKKYIKKHNLKLDIDWA